MKLKGTNKREKGFYFDLSSNDLLLNEAELEHQDKELTLANELVKKLNVKPIPSLFIPTFTTIYSCFKYY